MWEGACSTTQGKFKPVLLHVQAPFPGKACRYRENVHFSLFFMSSTFSANLTWRCSQHRQQIRPAAGLRGRDTLLINRVATAHTTRVARESAGSTGSAFVRVEIDRLLEFERKGHCLFRRLLTAEEVRQLKDVIDQVVQQRYLKALQHRVRVLCSEREARACRTVEQAQAALAAASQTTGFLQFFNLWRHALAFLWKRRAVLRSLPSAAQSLSSAFRRTAACAARLLGHVLFALSKDRKPASLSRLCCLQEPSGRGPAGKQLNTGRRGSTALGSQALEALSGLCLCEISRSLGDQLAQ